MTSTKTKPRTRLEFFTDTAPEAGVVTEIADGVFWLRMTLPMAGLDHINLYFLRDGDEYVVVDTGLGWKEAMDIWERVFAENMGGAHVNRVICTHLHPDHAGLAGWMCRKFDAPLLMTMGEYFLCRLMAADTGNPAPKEGVAFYKRAGFTDAQIELYKSKFGGFGKAISELPNGYQRIQDGDDIKVDNGNWQVLVGSGHSPEHACLYNAELKLMISGDQILPNISSNVSVWPTEPDGNPLEDWISSCRKLRELVPDDTLVMPAHGIPFRGADARLSRLIEHHGHALERLHKHCLEPRLSTEVYPALFRRKINDGNRLMAVGESIAHLNCLVKRGQMTRTLNAGGQYVYQSIVPELTYD